MTIEEQRVEVAKDAILQLQSEIYEPTDELYFSGQLKLKLSRAEKDVDAQPAVLENSKACDVCVKGALLLSVIRKYDGYTVGELYSYCGGSIRLFDSENLFLIEDYFQGWKSTDWIEIYPDIKLRMIAILENMIANNGTFVP